MISGSSWRETLLDRLIERDRKETKDSAIFKSLSFICDQKRQNDVLVATLSQHDSGKMIEEVTTENRALKKKFDNQNHIFEGQKEEISSLKEEVNSLQKSLRLLKDGYVELKGKYERTQEEAKIKSQNIEGINDSVLSLQIENNLLHKTIDKLKKENKALIDRWMDKASKDAEVINAANDVLNEAHEK